MLLLPATVTSREANDARRLLTQALKDEKNADSVIVDASNLKQFDSSALAVLLECQRAADAWGKPFDLRNAPSKLDALARLYGVDALLKRSPTQASGAAAESAATSN